MYVIHFARKPLSETSIVRNVLAHGTGSVNIDASRLPNDDKPPPKDSNKDTGKPWQDPAYNAHGEKYVFKESFARRTVWNPLGRFPANVILTHKPTCDLTPTGYCANGCPIPELDRKLSGASYYFKQVQGDQDEPGNQDGGGLPGGS